MIEATLRCLDIVTEGLADLPLSASSGLPSNMSARFRIGAAIAKACTVSHNICIVRLYVNSSFYGFT